MSLRLEIISPHRQRMRSSAVKEFGPSGGTIGRSLHTDWPLPDAQRYLSSKHAAIDFRSGSYYIVDTSTNGVFINDSTEPVGKGKPQRLFSGDTIRIGEYEMRAEIDSADNTLETCYRPDHVDPVEAAQRVESPDPTGHDLVDAFEITGVGLEFMLEEGEADTLTPLAYSFDTSDIVLAEESAAKRATAPADTTAKNRKVPEPATQRQQPTHSRQPIRSDSSSDAAPKKSARPQPAGKKTTVASKAQADPAGLPAGRQPTKRQPDERTQTAANTKPATAVRSADTARSAKPPARPAGTAHATALPTRPAGSADAAAPSARSTGSADAAAPQPVRPANATRATTQPATGALLTAFCEGAGIAAPKLGSHDEEQAFRQLGQVFQALLSGVTDSLRLRAMQKAQLNQPNTVIQQMDNNLLKFSANAGEALSRMLAPGSDEYQTAVESVQEAFADLNAHQRAMLKVLPGVLGRYIGQLDPDALEERFSSAGRSRLLGAANKLRYWDLYRDVYLVMAQQADDELPEAFTDMLSEAYEQEVERTKATNAAALLARKVG